jgi:hypothetical protein
MMSFIKDAQQLCSPLVRFIQVIAPIKQGIQCMQELHEQINWSWVKELVHKMLLINYIPIEAKIYQYKTCTELYPYKAW